MPESPSNHNPSLPAVEMAPADIGTMNRSWRTLGWAGMIVAATLAAYWPSVRGGLIWNDTDYVTAPHLRAWHGLWRIWFELGATQQYYPLLHSAFWLEHRFWGDATAGYHLANILLHAAAACLFAILLLRLGTRALS